MGGSCYPRQRPLPRRELGRRKRRRGRPALLHRRRGLLQLRGGARRPLQKRATSTAWEAESTSDVHRAYLRYARLANSQGFEDIEALNFLYTSGKDIKGRNIIFYCVAVYPRNISTERLLAFVVKSLEHATSEPYVMVYVDSGTSVTDTPGYQFFLELWKLFNVRYNATFDQLFVLHPSLGFRALFGAASFFMSFGREPTQYFHRLEDLNLYTDVQRLHLPPYVREYDARLRQSDGF